MIREYINNIEWPKESLAMLDFIMDIEDEFDIIISDAEAALIKNHEDLIDLVERKIGNVILD
jgi:acyl carrier protein